MELDLTLSLIEGLKDQSNPKVAIISKGSRASGLGHIYRSIYIAKDLWRNGIKTVFNDMGGSASAVLIDLPGREETLEVLCSIPKSKFRVVFDNDGSLVDLDADILVYPDFLSVRGISFRARKVLSGWNYIYPPLEIRLLKEASRSVGKDILILFGGADPGGYTLAFLQYLLRRGIPSGVVFNVVFGPLNRDYYYLSKVFLPDSIKVWRALRDISPLYASSFIVVSSGGLSFAYSVFLGKPTVGLPQSEMEKRRISFYSGRSPLVKLAFSIEDAIDKVYSLIEDPYLR